MAQSILRIPTAVMDLPSTLNFLASCALTRALAESVKIEWKSYDGSTFLNTVYALMPWKEKPGYAEFSMANRKQVQDRYAQLVYKCTEGWLQTFTQGPKAMSDYLVKMDRIRARDRENILAAARDAQSVNQLVVDECNSTMRWMAGISLGATIGVAGMGAMAGLAAVKLIGTGASIAGGTAFTAAGVPITYGAGSGAFALTNMAYSMLSGLAGSFDELSGSKVLGITGYEGGKYLGGEVGGKMAENMLLKAAADTQLQQGILAMAGRRIQECTRMLENTISIRLQVHCRYKAARAVKEQAAAQGVLAEAAKSSGKGLYLANKIPLVFAAWDVIDGCRGFYDTWTETR